MQILYVQTFLRSDFFDVKAFIYFFFLRMSSGTVMMAQANIIWIMIHLFMAYRVEEPLENPSELESI